MPESVISGNDKAPEIPKPVIPANDILNRIAP